MLDVAVNADRAAVHHTFHSIGPGDINQIAHADRVHCPVRLRRDAGLPVATLAVAWTLTHEFVGSTIIGATAPEQLTDTLAASGTTLSAEVLAACTEVTKELRYPMG